MITASQLRAGMVIRHEGQTYKVLLADYHPGQGKMGGATHSRLKNLETGTTWEHSFRSDLKLADVAVERQSMEFLYSDADGCYFMHPETYEQITIPAETIGEQARFLTAGMQVPVEMVESSPVSVLFPDFLEVRIADTTPPVHQQQDSTWKPAQLENGVEVMVPQFIKAGDAIRLDMNTLKYMDRAKGTGK
ncbi:MAG TPA: elongation factor P [Bryobacteraceae bacterium]|nr:elongation factor P [Bryobacteraceae bacterium]